MMRVELCELSSFFAMVVPCRSGVTWVANAGGMSRYEPEVEGVLVPLDYEMRPFPDVVLHDLWYTKALQTDPRHLVHEYLSQNAHARSFFEVDPNLPLDIEFGEAWVPVVVRNPVPDLIFASLVRPFAGRRAFLTYTNSA